MARYGEDSVDRPVYSWVISTRFYPDLLVSTQSPQAAERGSLVATAPSASTGPQILAPILSGLSPALADLAAALPVGDANGMLLAELDRLDAPPPENLVAGVFANDPFRGIDTLLSDLAGRGVRAIVNWPSVGPLTGELAAAYRHSGMTLEVELDCLRRARAMGMAAFALVTEGESARAALAHDVEGLVITPGLAVPDPEARRAAAHEAGELLRELAVPETCWLYAHPQFSEWPGDAAVHAHGEIVWDIDGGAADRPALQSSP